jgi:hypothetical protein
LGLLFAFIVGAASQNFFDRAGPRATALRDRLLNVFNGGLKVKRHWRPRNVRKEIADQKKTRRTI